MSDADDPAKIAATRAARESYGRLIARLATRWGDVAAAEDALAEAFRLALETWPRDGVPASPEAWLMTVAKRRRLDAFRRDRTRERALGGLVQAAEMAQRDADAATDQASEDPMGTVISDERLALLFACAHPAIESSVRTPLMLQTVLGLDAAQIAAAFLVRPATMAQRLVRAKTKIRQARIPFVIPDASERPERLNAVLDAVYAAYGAGWTDLVTGQGRDLTEEAIWLARLVHGLTPDEPETGGLLALLLHCEARRGARRSADGGFVPLAEQDTRLWDAALAREAETVLRAALAHGAIGRYQLEASIQSAHAARAVTGSTDWDALLGLYQTLLATAPSLGAAVAHAAALGEARDPASGLAALASLEAAHADRLKAYQPYWAARAHLAGRAGAREDARAAYDRALGLTDDPAVAAFLAKRRDALA